jgi:hypothetical protein
LESLKSTKIAYKVGLGSLLVAAIIGVLVRVHYLSTLPGFIHKNWLHAHSHITFLGWVFLGIIALLNHHFRHDPDFPHRRFITLTWLILVANTGMLIAFPIQGYGSVSIFFSAFHMALGIYAFILYRRFLNRTEAFGLKMIRSAFIFMILSGIGPLALGPIIAFGYKDTYWYDFAVYFYLHFQYNGWFTLALLGIVFLSLGVRNIHKGWLYTINVSIIVTYLLSTLGTRPAGWVYYVGGFGALLQILPFIFLLILVLKNYRKVFVKGRNFTNLLILTALIAFETKLYLQFFSSIPSIADWALHSRNIIIAYLHFVLLGFVTSFLLGWWNRIMYRKDGPLFVLATSLYLTGMIAVESTLLLYALGVFNGYLTPYRLLLIFSIILTAGIFLFFIDAMKKR